VWTQNYAQFLPDGIIIPGSTHVEPLAEIAAAFR
jgi:hypothetical protein